MFERLFKGTGSITKLMFRQNRLKIFIWIAILVSITLATAALYPGVYKTEQDVMAFALTMENPAMEAMIGPGYELDEYNTALIFANEMLLFTAIAVAVMNILLVGRATRGDEEEGQFELIRALPVGRQSYLVASLIMAFMINTLLFLFIGVGLYMLDLEGMTLEGTLLYGAILSGTGLVFASFTALFAQLSQTSRGTTGLSFAFLIAAYLIRAIGDTTQETLSLFSPLGWTVRTDVFSDNKWWPVLISILLMIILVIITFYLNHIRDMGAGFLPERKGRSEASRFLMTPLGFAFRLEKITILSWGSIIFLLSVAFGSILGELETYFADMELLQVYLENLPGSSMSEQFISILMVIMSIISTIPVVIVATKIKSEEHRNRTELIYSQPLSRYTYMGSYLLLAILSSVLFQALIAFGLWSVGKSVMENPLARDTTFQAAFVYLPAIWVIMGIALFFVGFKPNISGLVWLYFVYCLLIAYLGDLLDLPEWANKLSVFYHIPAIPGEEIKWLTMVILVILAIILNGLGFISYRNRDITG